MNMNHNRKSSLLSVNYFPMKFVIFYRVSIGKVTKQGVMGLNLIYEDLVIFKKSFILPYLNISSICEKK